MTGKDPVMPDAASTRSHVSFLTLNDDGQRHPLENALAVFTLVTGLITFAVGWVVSLHALASILGIVSLLVGPRRRRFTGTGGDGMTMVPAPVAAFGGPPLGLAQGGFGA